jgi:hypothetical protein
MGSSPWPSGVTRPRNAAMLLAELLGPGFTVHGTTTFKGDTDMHTSKFGRDARRSMSISPARMTVLTPGEGVGHREWFAAPVHRSQRQTHTT